MMNYALRIALLSIVTFTAQAQTQPPADFFPIMAWSGVPTDLSKLGEMRECGINMLGPTEAANLDACKAAGLKVLVNDPRAGGYGNWQGVDEAVAKKNVDALVAETAKNPAAYAYLLDDEPHTAAFPSLAAVIKDFHAAAPDKIPFVNLLPNYATNDQLGATSYDDYLEKFCTTCNPSIISYDHYALFDDGSLRDGYYQNLEAVRRASIKHKIPFWNVVLSLAHFSYRAPNLADFSFQAYTTLACGGRGIVYFLYTNPIVGNYRLAPIDQFGHKTETWYAMQNVNLQVQNLAPIFLKMHSDDVYHIGNVPHDCHGPSKSSLVKAVGGGADYLVGDFTHEDGSRYVLIVNKDMKKSHPCFPEFTTPVKQVRVILPWGKDMITNYDGEQQWLAPGSAALLKLE